jgi:hypothetical protein
MSTDRHLTGTAGVQLETTGGGSELKGFLATGAG